MLFRSRVLDRLNVHTLDGFDLRAQVCGLVAHHLKPGMFRKAPAVGDGAFRRLAQKAHPDTGGSHELFIRITEARNALLGRD